MTRAEPAREAFQRVLQSTPPPAYDSKAREHLGLALRGVGKAAPHSPQSVRKALP